MHRIDNASSSSTLPTPQSPGPNVDGFFQVGTILTHDWLNAIQEEICYCIEQAGFTLDKTNQSQLYAAIQYLISIGPSSPGIDHVVEDTNPKLGGILYTGDSTNNYVITSLLNDDIIFSTSYNIELQGKLLVEMNLVHDGDIGNKISFSLESVAGFAQDFSIDGASIFDISSDGLRLGGSGPRVNAILNEPSFTSNSDTALFTKSSFENYATSVISSAPSGKIIYAPIFLQHSSSAPTTERSWIGWGEIGVFNNFRFSYGNLHRALVIPFTGIIKNIYIMLEETLMTGVTPTMNFDATLYLNFIPQTAIGSYTGVVKADSPATRINLFHVGNVHVVAGDEISLRINFSGIPAGKTSCLKGSISFLLE